MTTAPRRRRSRLFTAFAAVAGAAVVLAATTPRAHADSRKEATGVDGSASIEEGYIDNVRGDRLRRDGAWYSELQAEGDWRHGMRWLPDRVGALMRARVYASYGNRDFAELGPRFGWDWKRLSFDVDYVYSPDRLRVDPDSAVDAFADGHDLAGELRSKFGHKKRWTATFQFQFEADFYDASFRERSFYEETVETGLRYRMTDWFSPRASFSYLWRDAISSNYDREEAKLLVGFDAYLPAQIRATFRLEKGWRNFIVGFERDGDGERNNNFGREDDAYEVETGLDVPLPWLDSTVAHLLYRHYDNESSREERSFYVNEASLRISYEF